MDIFYHELSYVEMKQVATLNPLTVVGEMGGFMALTAGVSLFTVFKAVDSCCSGAKDKFKRLTGKTPEEDEEELTPESQP